LTDSLKTHAQQTVRLEQAVAEQNQRHWDRLQQTMAQSTESLAALEKAMVHQGEVLGRAIEAAGEVTKLEDALNHNLAALAGSKNFADTVTSLAAAIHLLVSRLGELPADFRTVRLETPRRPGHAA
jgi:hypothetical protein